MVEFGNMRRQADAWNEGFEKGTEAGHETAKEELTKEFLSELDYVLKWHVSDRVRGKIIDSMRDRIKFGDINDILDDLTHTTDTEHKSSFAGGQAYSVSRR